MRFAGMKSGVSFNNQQGDCPADKNAILCRLITWVGVCMCNVFDS